MHFPKNRVKDNADYQHRHISQLDIFSSQRKMQSACDQFKFNIQGDILLNELECMVCHETIKQAHITKCGHSFCKDCIFESINRNHKCALCQEPLTAQEVFKNFLIDNILELLNSSMTRAKKQAIEGAFEMQIEAENHNTNRIKQALKDSLSMPIFKYSSKINEIEAIYSNRIQDTEDVNRKKELQQEVEGVMNSVLESLSNSVKASVREFEELDSRVRLVVPKYNLRIESYQVANFSLVSDFKSTLFGLFQSNNNPISEEKFDETKVCLINVPLSLDSQAIIEKISAIQSYSCQNIGVVIATIEETVKAISSTCVLRRLKSQQGEKELMRELRLTAGGTLIVIGDFICKSEEVHNCIKSDFQPGKALDYYSCVTCNLNWICDSCAVKCHGNHDKVVQLRSHAPNWACCYCFSKSTKCTLKNKK